MEPTSLTHEQVEERDLEAGYLAGRLSEPDAEAYEAHLFSCDRCWATLRTAQAVAGARAPAAIGRRRRWFMPTAIAAGVAALLAGTWWVSPEGRVPAPEALRGASDAMALEVDVRDDAAAIRFAAVPGADHYRVRLFAPDGQRLDERTTPDTSLTLPLGRAVAGLLVEVTALDPLLQAIATSGLVRIEAPAP